MVKIHYVPPPFGPMTSLGRPPYGAGTTNPFLSKLAKMNPTKVTVAGVLVSMVLAYIPCYIFDKPYPRSMSPDYEAATRAYMRYHNMNPISGISSKKYEV